MAEGTSARPDTVTVAARAGWQIESTKEVDRFTKGGATIEVRYSPSDAIDSAVKRGANGRSEKIGQESVLKVTSVRSWLTGFKRSKAGDSKSAAGPDTAQSRLYWDFWLQFRDSVATKHPDWKARAGTSRTAPNATLPASTPRTAFCSAFKPGPLRLELIFIHPDPAVNLARFDALRAKKEWFEQALGDSAVWDEMEGRNDTRVFIESSFHSVGERDKWPAMIDWLIEQHLRFKRAIQIVGGLDGADQ